MRTVSEEATFKPSTLQSALLKFDKKNDCKFSKAAKTKPEAWAQASRNKVSDALRKENKRWNSQKCRDETKQAEETTPTQAITSPKAKPTKGTRLNGPDKAMPNVECAIPGYRGPTKLVAIPEAVSEEVLAATLKAAMGAATLLVEGVTVSAPSGLKAMSAAAKEQTKEKDEENEEEGEEDEEVEEEEGGKEEEETKDEHRSALKNGIEKKVIVWVWRGGRRG